ncbi:unnamed protein product [Haemonchus placei]|uniref:Tubulin--tyrosine ligase-like protein 12 n=1 Tax=Haemonchus placei TaxID=6290 RepID=A0A0N4W2E8_HAEPC|nr:unnamed protein product [Haemonchus placei]
MEFGDYRFEHFLHGHKDQLEAGGIPPELWGSLYSKLMQQTFDAGNYFRILCEETDDGRNWSVFATRNLHPIDEYNIFLIDHAWTFRPQQAREQLEEHPQLVDRMARLLDITAVSVFSPFPFIGSLLTISLSDAPLPRLESVDARLCCIVNEDDTMIDAILRKMWQYIQTYTVRFKPVDEEGMPVWYIMDEFGVRISHSDTPNVRVVPLYFIPHNAAYSVVFLIKEVADEEICRDYADNILARRQPEWRRYLMMPWLEKEFELEEEIERQPPDENFFISGRTLDALPTDADQQLAVEALKKRDLSRPLRIYADGLQMIESLSEVKYEEVCNWRDADVLWLKRHFLSVLFVIFPHESCLTVKDLLSAILMDQNGGEGPTCFNLNTELPLFVSYFLHRQANGLENIWIIKPWNLARGMDMFVSNDLRQIIRLTESGPKIACKYVEHPVLFPRVDNQCRVKFDLRYIVFVTRVRPLRAYVYNNFWIRFALNEFSLHRLDDVNTHFTVFNYGDDTKVLQMECPKFIKHIEEAHPCIKWANVQKQINQVLRNALDAACHWDPPRGMAKNAQSRAMYGADVMLKWKVQPTLLEFNFMPDCERAINYYPDFADTVFRTLFLNDINPKLVTEI